MDKFFVNSAKKARVVSLAGLPLALLLAQPLPLCAQSISSGIDTEKSPEGTAFMSGGVGQEERARMLKMAQGYDLKLEFADRHGGYLSDVKVTVDDQHGKQILRTTTAGPWLYVELPQGKYDVKASFGDRTNEIKDLEISQGRPVSRLLHWESTAQQIS
jgi:hypothetical protein